jgi:hypothetical protein
MAGRLDSEQIETLRAWGVGLASDEREEVRAAGKAITLLVDEIDRLNIDLWNLRAGEEGTDPAKRADDDAAASGDHSIGTALRDRLRRRTRSEPGV